MTNVRQRTVAYMDPNTPPPFPERIGVVGDDENWEDVLEPGDLVLTLGSKPISTFIRRMDGFFSHTTLYLGEGWVAEAARHGVQAVPIEELRGSASMAMARPSLPKAVRQAAAAWAGEHTARSRNGEAIEYGTADLGQAFAILLRAQVLPGRDAAPAISESDMEMVLAAEEASAANRNPAHEETSTCSGFAWRAYAECEGGIPLVPAMLEGVLIDDDGRVRSSDGRTHDQARVNPLWFKAFPAAAKLLSNTDRSVLLSDVVGPGDLWCSPTVGRRQFLGSRYAEHAGFTVSGGYVDR